MSQDLFAAFAGPSAGHTSPDGWHAHGSSLFTGQSKPHVGSSFELSQADGSGDVPDEGHLDDDGDDFGDFEDASAPSQVVTMAPVPARSLPDKSSEPHPLDEHNPHGGESDARIGRHPFADHMDFLFSGGDTEYDAGVDDLEDLSRNPEAAMEFSKRMVAARQFQESRSLASNPDKQKVDKAKPTEPTRSPNKLRKKSGYAPAKDPDVLFDADMAILEASDNSGLEDFGDFEGKVSSPHIRNKPQIVSPTSKHTGLPGMDLLGMNDTVDGLSVKTQSSSQKRTTHKVQAQQNPHQSLPLRVEIDDAWDDFEVAEPNQQTQRPETTTPVVSVFQDSKNTYNPASMTNHPDDSVPPTNVPPPAVLLSVFPSLLTSAQQSLLDPISRLAPAQRQQLATHPASLQLLRNHLRTSITLAHIIAGRKLRWKRDQYLAQGMRIGPATAGGKSGMKLTGVDKSEVAKEDREVLDVVRHWKASVGKLRGAVASANSRGESQLPAVVEISEQMPVKTLKAVDGGFVAPHACAICGLKREERVAKVDVDVSDSFGEWWAQKTSMHVNCRQFWEDNKLKLRSR